jgi:hypothetical protein
MLGQLREIFGRDSVVKAVRDQLQCWAGTGAEEEDHRRVGRRDTTHKIEIALCNGDLLLPQDWRCNVLDIV